MDDLIDTVVQLTGSLFPSRPTQEFTVTSEPFSSLTEAILRDFLQGTTVGDHVGLAGLFHSQRRLSSVVFATPSRVLHVTGLSVAQRKRSGSRLLERLICCNDNLRLFGADMDVLAYGLFTDAGTFVSNGIDLQSLTPQDLDRDALENYTSVLGTRFGQAKPAIRDVFWSQSSTGNPIAKAVVRAREYAVAARQPGLRSLLQRAHRVSTKAADAACLAVMAKIHRDNRRLDAMKPTVQKNDISKDAKRTKDGLVITCARFKTRIRLDGNQTHVIKASNGSTVSARLKKVKGKATTFSGKGALPTQLKSVTTLGKESLTCAEKDKEEILLHFLQRRVSFRDNMVFTAIWIRSPGTPPMPASVLPVSVTVPLNASQELAVRTVLIEPPTRDVAVQLVLGPPGTGKTSTITAMVQALRATRQPVWIVAQSNVAVKNIAVKLGKCGFLDFKLLVSYDFHFDWHEHLYQHLESNIVRSDKFGKLDGPLTVERVLRGSCVILCTVSMLSNPSMRRAGFVNVVPVENLLVDEASQIDIGDYLSAAHAFHGTLRRLVFVGDDKQLAPYGQDDIPGLQSIFELGSHRTRALMLDQCYRLPTPICSFISQHMYESRLHSVHEIATRRSCKFVDVRFGAEVQVGRSWTNQVEADTCIALAQRLYDSGRRDFRIITPYDAQRKVLEDKLRATTMRWEDTVFCVDSFQGNEADYIIISLARTKKPGFMTNARRTNVMLTRCKKGMYVCTKRDFLQSSAAKDTLVGKMAKEWGSGGWISTIDVMNGTGTVCD